MNADDAFYYYDSSDEEQEVFHWELEIDIPDDCVESINAAEINKIMATTELYVRFENGSDKVKVDDSSSILVAGSGSSSENRILKCCELIGNIINGKYERDLKQNTRRPSATTSSGPLAKCWGFSRIPVTMFKRCFEKDDIIQAIASESRSTCEIGHGTNLEFTYIFHVGLEYQVRRAKFLIAQKSVKSYDRDFDEHWGKYYGTHHCDDDDTVHRQHHDTTGRNKRMLLPVGTVDDDGTIHVEAKQKNNNKHPRMTE